MTAIEAIIFCLGKVSDTPEDGELRSQCVVDMHDERHWIAWRAWDGGWAVPCFCGESAYPFSRDLEPYRMGE